jgi:fructoselysine 3-epimerase
MKLGTATSVLHYYAIQDAIAVVAEAGYDGVDIWGGRPHVYRHDWSTQELNALRQRMASYGLGASSLMPAFYRYPHSLSNPNANVRRDSIEYMCVCVDNAAILGAKVVLVVPDHSLHGQTAEESRKRMTESVGQVADYAKQYDLKLGLEVLFWDETDLITSTDQALAIIDELGGASNLGVVLDSGALHLSKEPLAEVLAKLGERFLQIHVSDHQGLKQQNLIPGEGTYDFGEMMRVLLAHNYTGYISAELSREYADEPLTALRTTAERLRGWIAAAQPARGQ